MTNTIRSLARRAMRQLTDGRPTRLLSDGTITALRINARRGQVTAAARLVALDVPITGTGDTLQAALNDLAANATTALRAARPGSATTTPPAPVGRPTLRVIAGGKSASAPDQPRPVA